MRRFHRGRSRGSRRKKRWEFVATGAQQGSTGLINDAQVTTAAFWARVPAGVVDPVTGFPVPDDHTLLRTLGYSTVSFQFPQA